MLLVLFCLGAEERLKGRAVRLVLHMGFEHLDVGLPSGYPVVVLGLGLRGRGLKRHEVALCFDLEGLLAQKAGPLRREVGHEGAVLGEELLDTLVGQVGNLLLKLLDAQPVGGNLGIGFCADALDFDENLLLLHLEPLLVLLHLLADGISLGSCLVGQGFLVLGQGFLVLGLSLLVLGLGGHEGGFGVGRDIGRLRLGLVEVSDAQQLSCLGLPHCGHRSGLLVLHTRNGAERDSADSQIT